MLLSYNNPFGLKTGNEGRQIFINFQDFLRFSKCSFLHLTFITIFLPKRNCNFDEFLGSFQIQIPRPLFSVYLSLAVKESFFWTIIRSTYHQLQAIGEPLKGYTTGWQLLFEEELQPWDFANVFFFRVTMTCPYLSLGLPFCREGE